METALSKGTSACVSYGTTSPLSLSKKTRSVAASALSFWICTATGVERK